MSLRRASSMNNIICKYYALTQIHRYDRQRAQFTTWLHTITVSRARDKHRRNRWWQPANLLGLDRLTKMADESPSPVIWAEQATQREDILQAVQMLKPIQREVLMLRYWGEHTIEEIAQIVDCPVGTVKSRLRLAHKKLEPMLAASLSDSGADRLSTCLPGNVADNIFEGV